MPTLGIIGFERSGKTSLFNAVTGTDQPVGFATHREPHVGVVKVPDDRLDRLSAIYQPKRITPADLQYLDFPGAGFAGGAGPETRFLAELSQMDALIHVVRAFQNDAVPHPQGSVDPQRDIDGMTLELIFADIGLVEKRLHRLAEETKAMKAAERETANREAEMLRRIQGQLADDVPVRAMSLTPEERGEIGHYRFLTDRPLLTLLNISESEIGDAESIVAQFRPSREPTGTATAAVCAALEMELRALQPEDAAEYRNAVRAVEGALEAAIRLSYHILGLISFFTLGQHECRASTIRSGATVHQAAGKIHTDMERGFIRAEVVSWNDLVDAGSEAEAKKRALVHTEGKDYIVQDGDVLHILFNV